jgi:hypothetical protein
LKNKRAILENKYNLAHGLKFKNLGYELIRGSGFFLKVLYDTKVLKNLVPHDESGGGNFLSTHSPCNLKLLLINGLE